MTFSIYDVTADWAERAGLSCLKQKEIGSTNDWAKEHAFQESQALSLYLADHQTKGRGRGTHTWTDQGHGHFLLSSWSFMMLQAAQPILAPALGLSLFKAAQATWMGFPWSLKAPNDLYLGEKKVAGLLIESVQEGTKHRLVVGLGVNVHAHPNVDRSGSLGETIPAEEINPEIWRQFLDRLLLEFTSTLLLTEKTVLHSSQQRGLLFALNHFPLLKTPYAKVFADGGLELKDGKKISWFDL
jgi:BirA family biotin operon repressor/biotin-[acetyl-CoA-carboxylase] ligase